MPFYDMAQMERQALGEFESPEQESESYDDELLMLAMSGDADPMVMYDPTANTPRLEDVAVSMGADVAADIPPGMVDYAQPVAGDMLDEEQRRQIAEQNQAMLEQDKASSLSYQLAVQMQNRQAKIESGRG